MTTRPAHVALRLTTIYVVCYARHSLIHYGELEAAVWLWVASSRYHVE